MNHQPNGDWCLRHSETLWDPPAEGLSYVPPVTIRVTPETATTC